MIVYVASFVSVDETIILGVLSSEILAEQRIKREIDFDRTYRPHYPRRYQQNRNNYYIQEFLIDDNITSDDES